MSVKQDIQVQYERLKNAIEHLEKCASSKNAEKARKLRETLEATYRLPSSSPKPQPVAKKNKRVERVKQKQIRKEIQVKRLKFAIWLFSGYFIISTLNAALSWIDDSYIYSDIEEESVRIGERVLLSFIITTSLFYYFYFHFDKTGWVLRETCGEIIFSSVFLYKFIYYLAKKILFIPEIIYFMNIDNYIYRAKTLVTIKCVLDIFVYILSCLVGTVIILGFVNQVSVEAVLLAGIIGMVIYNISKIFTAKAIISVTLS